jgi:hypothetical protein
MLKTILAATLVAVFSTSALAGITPSQTITPLTDTREECNPGVFAQAMAYSYRWQVDGQITNLEIGVDEAATSAAIKAWNTFVLAEGVGNQALLIADANQYIRVTVVPSDVNPLDILGDYIFLYKDGCYVAEGFVPAKNLTPDNPTPAFQYIRSAIDPLENTSSKAPGSSFRDFRQTYVKNHG